MTDDRVRVSRVVRSFFNQNSGAKLTAEQGSNPTLFMNNFFGRLSGLRLVSALAKAQDEGRVW
jgi:hypothetical protein